MKKSVKDLLDEAAAQVKRYGVDEAKHLVGRDDVVFVDVREGDELRREGKIPGAVHASRGLLEFHIDPHSPAHIETFREDKEFIFYCKSGARSLLAAQRAKEMGLERAASLDGGMTAWKAQGGPVEPV
ncbi:MAG TPA: rhodanese-like domain-containing protein [Limnochordia bacterium]